MPSLFSTVRSKSSEDRTSIGGLRLLFILSVTFAGLMLYLGYTARRTDFQPFIAVYLAAFALYLWLMLSGGQNDRWLVRLGILLRIALLFSIPHFSDDIYRFLWDGRLGAAGLNPFLYTPVEVLENGMSVPGVDAALFAKLNSPEYYSVYPAVCQAVFALAGFLFPSGEWGGVVIIKLFLLACETGTIAMLRAGGYANGRAAVWYALNPLLIFEIASNAHFEGAMIFFLLAGVTALEKGRLFASALFWALATATKMLPLMFLPLVWSRLGRRQGLLFMAVFGAASILLFIPLLVAIPNVASSLDLYFRQFQFNASIYYLLRGAGFWLKGYDTGETIGPVLGIATVAGILVIAVRLARERSAAGFYEALLLASVLHLAFSATVHPWYATLPLTLGLLAGRCYPVVWSCLIAVSYSHYAGGGFREHYGWIALEYAVLFAAIYLEYRRKSR
ncbi:MAG: hypothetical protein R2791_06005 [Saprospiraceae bacterium]